MSVRFLAIFLSCSIQKRKESEDLAMEQNDGFGAGFWGIELDGFFALKLTPAGGPARLRQSTPEPVVGQASDGAQVASPQSLSSTEASKGWGNADSVRLFLNYHADALGMIS
jgi:hypothetical protein